ncbi:MAG: DNA mismatch repair endonuclease MutL [Clostridia bacterium]|nr:DNA mismatch repair endonuclease MutL [Clostridia bacterium]
MKILVLPETVSNQIAAGEVIERPASVVKELVENAIDAGSTEITVEIGASPAEYMRISDNGSGIPYEDAPLAFKRHATSKIRTANDLLRIDSLGFRGEALASIASVAKVVLRSSQEDVEHGVLYEIEAGHEIKYQPCAHPVGTAIEVSNLFYNIPARLKFLKSNRSESAFLADYMARLILSRPDIAFKLVSNDKVIYRSPGDGKLSSAIYSIYGAAILPELIPLQFDNGYVSVVGFVGTEAVAQSNRNRQSFFLNGRYIKSQRLSVAVQQAFESRLLRGRFPFIVAHIRIAPSEVDVNVHPNKLEVRFKFEDRLFGSLYRSVMDALSGKSLQEAISCNEAVETEGQLIKTPPAASRSALTPENRAIFVQAYENARTTARPPQRIEPYTSIPTHLAESSTPPYMRDDRIVVGDIADIRGRAETDKNTSPSATYGEESPADDARARVNVEAPRQIALDADAYHFIGRIFGTYIVVEQGEDAFFIDQHAAHERVLYEEYASRDVKTLSQLLMIPLVVKLDALEYDTVISNMDLFESFGCELEDYGAMSVIVRALPSTVDSAKCTEFLKDAASLIQDRTMTTSTDLRRAALIQAACKHAVKGGQYIDDVQTKRLLEHYAVRGVPLTCPHGRPVIVKMSKRDFEKLFKRIV